MAASLRSRLVLTTCLVLVFIGGGCALAWQILWQMEIALMIGASVEATAITVAVTMGGLAAGALSSPAWVERRLLRWNPLTLLGVLEILIVLTAGLPIWLGGVLSEIDTLVFQKSPSLAGVSQFFLSALTLGPATFLMGVTVPVFGKLSHFLGKECGRRIAVSHLYAMNLLGAVLMVGAVAFYFLPVFGRAETTALVFLIQLGIGFFAVFVGARASKADVAGETGTVDLSAPLGRVDLGLAFASGFVVLALEVVWFRLLRIAWLSTTDAFALMLMTFLLALFIGARCSGRLTANRHPASFLLAGGVLALLATPLLERFDGWSVSGGAYGPRVAGRIALSLLVMGPPVVLMGVCLPALLDRAGNVRSWARLYALNTFGAVLGSLGTAWLLFPLVGPVASSWILASAAALAGLLFSRRKEGARGQVSLGLAAVATALAMAIFFATGVGRSRASGPTVMLRGEHTMLAHRDAPDSSTSVISIQHGRGIDEQYRVLFIDGYAASAEFGNASHYMVEMGRLPTAMHPGPESALVICYGTGQTANAVRNYGAERIDIVDINPAVFELSPFFPGNEKVLDDPKVTTQVMDGRAWLRRSSQQYDVVTLEPMPPFFSGSNALYSTEFYEEINRHLNDGGMVAQWFPMHLMSTAHARAVAASFLAVFPAAVLWIDPLNRDSGGAPQQGILLGIQGSAGELNERLGIPVPVEVALFSEGLKRFTKGADEVTDDNQLLAYGREGLHRFDLSRRRFAAETYAAVRAAAARDD